MMDIIFQANELMNSEWYVRTWSVLKSNSIELDELSDVARARLIGPAIWLDHRRNMKFQSISFQRRLDPHLKTMITMSHVVLVKLDLIS